MRPKNGSGQTYYDVAALARQARSLADRLKSELKLPARTGDGAAEPPFALTLDEAARMLRTSKRTVWQLIRSGKLRGFRLARGKGRGVWRTTIDAIEEFVADQVREAAEQFAHINEAVSPKM